MGRTDCADWAGRAVTPVMIVASAIPPDVGHHVERLTEAGDDPASQRPGCLDRHLLAEDGTDRHFEASQLTKLLEQP